MQLYYVKALYEYNYWANNRILTAVEGINHEQLHMYMSNGVGSIHTTLVHIVSGEWIWRMRWQGEKPTSMLHPEDFPTLEIISQRWQEEEQQMRTFIATLSDDSLTNDIKYTSTAQPGKIFTRPLWQLLIHLVNHGTQHRSEIAMKLTELNHSPGELGMSTFFNR